MVILEGVVGPSAPTVTLPAARSRKAGAGCDVSDRATLRGGAAPRPGRVVHVSPPTSNS
jgi:hypothetical protein